MSARRARTRLPTTAALAVGLCIGLVVGPAGISDAATALPPFTATTHTVTAADLPSSYRAGCPVSPSRLRLLRLLYVGFDGKAHQGELVVHEDSAERVLRTFYTLYAFRFPIQRMQRVDVFGGDDNRSMDANNTSAFNCRRVAGTTSWSEHAYGRAIDLNPIQNPYVSGGTVSPPAGRAYLDRGNVRTGMVIAGDRVVRNFKANGWTWGGYWTNSKDYQHFASGNDGRLPPPPPGSLSSCAAPAAAPPASPPSAAPLIVRYSSFHLRHSQTSGAGQTCFNYGQTIGDVPLTGDWDGNGTRTPGVFRGGAWHLRNSNSQGAAHISLSYGRAGDFPVVGDWDGNGTDTIGVRREGSWYLRNSNTSGVGEINFGYGRAGDVPVTGDWNGDGVATVGVYRDGTWHLSNSHNQGVGDISTPFGRSTDRPVVTDWDGNGTDTIGVFRSGVWYLSSRNDTTDVYTQFAYGSAGDTPLAWR